MKSLKLYDGIKLTHNGNVDILKCFPDIWVRFGWDIESDREADKCASMITRELIAFGFIDLSMLTDGEELKLEIIPV